MYYKLPNEGYYTVRCDYCGKYLYKTETPQAGPHHCKPTSDNEMSCKEKSEQPKQPAKEVPYPPSWGDTEYLGTPEFDRSKKPGQ